MTVKHVKGNCYCGTDDGEIRVEGMTLGCTCPCHEEPQYVGGELARKVFGPGGLADRLRASRQVEVRCD